MLVIKLKEGSLLRVGKNIFIRVGEARGGYASIGIDAPRELRIDELDGDNEEVEED